MSSLWELTLSKRPPGFHLFLYVLQFSGGGMRDYHIYNLPHGLLQKDYLAKQFLAELTRHQC